MDGKNSTKATVVTKPRISVNVARALTETTFHKRFAQAVELVDAGKPLPATRPESGPARGLSERRSRSGA